MSVFSKGSLYPLAVERMKADDACVQSVQMGKWALLAAMQALSIYIIVRLEEAACENDIDSLLVNTVIVSQ